MQCKYGLNASNSVDECEHVNIVMLYIYSVKYVRKVMKNSVLVKNILCLVLKYLPESMMKERLKISLDGKN
jgi:hypothetical protein